MTPEVAAFLLALLRAQPLHLGAPTAREEARLAFLAMDELERIVASAPESRPS